MSSRDSNPQGERCRNTGGGWRSRKNECVAAGATKAGAGVLSCRITQGAAAARSTLSAHATAAASTAVAAAKSSPEFLSDAGQQLTCMAKAAPGQVIEAAKNAPQATSAAWETLLGALERSSQLAGMVYSNSSFMRTALSSLLKHAGLSVSVACIG
jgi:hypothetical protein